MDELQKNNISFGRTYTVKLCYLEVDGTVLKSSRYLSVRDIEGKILRK